MAGRTYTTYSCISVAFRPIIPVNVTTAAAASVAATTTVQCPHSLH